MSLVFKMVHTKHTLISFIKHCQARGLSPRTIQWYESILRCFSRECPKLPRKPEPCESFICSCRAGDERRHGYYRALKVFYNFIHKRYSFPNAMSQVEALRRSKKLPRPMALGDLTQLLTFPHPARIHGSINFGG